MRGPDVGTMLTRALVEIASNAGCMIEIAQSRWDAWASATFGGARHTIAIRSEDEAFAEWLGSLPEAQFSLNGHLVADVAIDTVCREGRYRVATISALTLADS